MSGVHALRPIDSARYAPHALHGPGRAWLESNCYIDVWIEAIHAMERDPTACLAFTLALDFEGDQWTFFKPPHRDLYDLYGVDVQELTVWRPLLAHVVEHLPQGKLILTEADAYFLPDAAGTDYRTSHTKTTIAIQEVDADARRLGYFHNGGYYSLEGDDFAGLFRLDAPRDPGFLPLYAELARASRLTRLSEEELVARSVSQARTHFARRPATSPMTRFKERFPRDVAWMQSEGLLAYHGYAFAALRQLGAGFELASLYLAWLGARGVLELDAPARDLMSISSTAKALVLKTARAVNAKKATDFVPMLVELEMSYASAMDALARRLGG